MSTHPLIHTRRSRIGNLFDVLLTIVGWVFFVVLFASGILNVLRGELHGPRELMVSPSFVPTTHTLMLYAALALFNAMVLIGWAGYNYRRFSGKERRRLTPPLPSQHLQSSFALSQALFDRARDAQVMVIAHDEQDSAISAVDITPQAALSRPAFSGEPPPEPLPAAELPAKPKPILPGKVQDDAPSRQGWQRPLPTMLYNNLRFQVADDYTLSLLPAGSPAR